jgi:hypothetical protein
VTTQSNLRQFPSRALNLSSRTMLVSLTEYERLVDEFCNEQAAGESVGDNTLRRLRLGELILWLRKREEERTSEHQKDSEL